ncbi:hypothetical protein K439DRAFT_1633390 [Ramaria rubella]|nr:hypothetical protein K439DRAFT_1633390 [Ramaria rubella]
MSTTATITTKTTAQADTVPATLLYFSPPADGAHPYLIVNADPITGKQESNFTQEAHTVDIENIRGKEGKYSLDTSGFKFFREPAKHTRFLDDEEIKREYYPESEELLKRMTGASRVILFDHTVRRHRPGQPDTSEDKRQPVPRVHVDQTPASAARRVHMHAPEALASELLKHRYQIINLWRPISHPAVDFPLALCDYRTVNWEKDLVPTLLKFGERDGETFSVKWNEAHRWKYVRGLSVEEGVLIKCFDSQMNGSVAVLTPHTAFKDPTTPEDAPYRESIELRALVFYEDDKPQTNGDGPYTNGA